MEVKPARLPVFVKSIHYAWVTLGIAIAMRLISSVERTASGVLVAYMVDPAGEFGWSRSVVGLALSLQWIFSGVFGPPAGWLGDRYGLRRTMAVGALLFLATSVLIGLVTVPWQFILYFGIFMSAALAIFQVPLITAVTDVVPQAPGRGHGIVAVRPGPGQRVVCAAHGRAADPVGLALGLLGARHCGGTAPVRADSATFATSRPRSGCGPWEPIRRPQSSPCRVVRAPAYGPPSFSSRPAAPSPSGTSSVSTTGGVPDMPSLSSIWRISSELRDCPWPQGPWW